MGRSTLLTLGKQKFKFLLAISRNVVKSSQILFATLCNTCMHIKGPCLPNWFCVLVVLFWNGSFVECSVLIGCPQVTIFNCAKFPQCIQGDNGTLHVSLIHVCKLCRMLCSGFVNPLTPSSDQYIDSPYKVNTL